MSLEIGEFVFRGKEAGWWGGRNFMFLFSTVSSCTLISNRPPHNFKNFKSMLYCEDILKVFMVVVSGFTGVRCK